MQDLALRENPTGESPELLFVIKLYALNFPFRYLPFPFCKSSSTRWAARVGTWRCHICMVATFSLFPDNSF